MLDNIPQSRIILYIAIGGLLPLGLLLFFFMGHMSDLDQMGMAVEQLQMRALSKERKQAINMAVRNHYRDADHFYIENQLETLKFLAPEIEELKKITTSKNYAEDENIKKRIEMLTGQGNRFQFTEGVVQSFPLFQETIETLVHPVELNVENLKEVLARIEGVTIGSDAPAPNRPQLIILDFKLDRKAMSERNEVFSLNLKLLKREFL